MKRTILKKLTPTLLSIALVGIFAAPATHAQTGAIAQGLLALAPWDFVWTILSNIMQAILTIVAYFVTLTGSLLNVAVFLTTNLGPFIRESEVIYSVWTIIRDLSSMVLIFFILWAAIQMILHLEQANYGALIKSIVIMGILINFSFFFTQIMIDASNIVSLQFFKAITPGQEYTPGSTIGDWTSKAFTDGGLSNVFMSALQVNAWYQNKGVVSGTNGAADIQAAPIRIVLVTFGGIIVMLLASFSFLAAAAVCILRTAMLIFLLAFSPIWIAARAMPQLKDASSVWWKHFKTQLIFLPTYLIFMYVAIRILSESGLNKLTTTAVTATVTASQTNLGAYTSLFVGFGIVIIMINVPLIAAIKVAGAGGGTTEKWFSSIYGWGRGKIVGGLQNTWKNSWNYTGGRAASAIARSDALQNFAASNLVGEYAYKGIKASASGYDKKLSQQVKSRTDFAESLGYDERAVRELEREKKLIQRQQTGFRASGDMNAAKSLQSNVDALQTEINKTKVARKQSYAERTNTRQVDTIWLKIARKDKEAASKINLSIWEPQLKKAEESLKDIRNDMKNIRQRAIGNTATGGTPTAQQQDELNKLTAKETETMDKIIEFEELIEQAKMAA